MNEAVPAVDVTAAIVRLREAGADCRDPVRFHFIEALARRTAAQQGRARDILEARLAAAVADYGQRNETPQNDAGDGVGRRSPLGDLVRYIEQLTPPSAEDGLAGNAGSRVELKSIRYFRNTWSKLSVDQQVAQAIDQAPENAGPLNSQFLVLQSLTAMRDISPDYLNRYMSYVDTLLCLDQAQPVVKKAPRPKPKKK